MANDWGCINSVMYQYTDEEQAARDAEKAKIDVTAELAVAKREERSKLLKETDWMTGSDVPSSIFTDAWKTYRQALRDLPAADGFPDVDMPTKPS